MENIFIEQPPLVLKGDNKKEELAIMPECILYLHAADNYTRIFFTTDGRVQSVLFRSTLKRQEEVLSKYPGFYRCHKKYLVNFRHVLNITGNAVSLKLHLQGVEHTLPVSRTLHHQTISLFEQCVS